jgi:hypothetical protein
MSRSPKLSLSFSFFFTKTLYAFLLFSTRATGSLQRVQTIKLLITKLTTAWVSSPRPAATFVNYIRILKLHNNLCGYLYHLLWYWHVRPVNQLTITAVALCQGKLHAPGPEPPVTASLLGLNILLSATLSKYHLSMLLPQWDKQTKFHAYMKIFEIIICIL